MSHTLSRAESRKFDELFARVQSIRTGSSIDPRNRFKYSLTAASPGDLIVDKNRELLVVEDIATYTEKGTDFTWKELKVISLQTGIADFIEIEEDDEIELSRSLEKLLPTDFSPSLHIDNLESLVDNEGSLNFQGETYRYDDDYEAWYQLQNMRSLVWIIDFRTVLRGIDYYISAEYWYHNPKDTDGEGDVEIWFSMSSELDDFEIIAKKNQT